MKKIIVFTSSGGNGHISATKAIQSYLDGEYTIVPVFIFDTVLGTIDPMSFITCGKITGEDVYNFFLRRRFYNVLNFIYKSGIWYFKIRKSSIVRLIDKYLRESKPDLIISVTPVINNVILETAQKNNIPFLIVPTDFDLSGSLNGIDEVNYSNFMITLGLNDQLVKATLKNVIIKNEQMKVTGLPIRKDFFEPKNISELKKQFGVVEGKPVIVLIMGGQGNTSILEFSKEIAQLAMPVHVIICLGRNSEIANVVKKINFAPHISFTVLGFTEQISDLLAMADLLITKSGSISFAEGITLNIPMILDATTTLLYWERLNHILLSTHGWGISLTNKKNLNSAIIQILGDSKQYHEIKQNLEKVHKKRLDVEIKPIIEKLINSKTTH